MAHCLHVCLVCVCVLFLVGMLLCLHECLRACVITVAFVCSLSASPALGLLVRCLCASDAPPFAFFLSSGDTVCASWECCQLAD